MAGFAGRAGSLAVLAERACDGSTGTFDYRRPGAAAMVASMPVPLELHSERLHLRRLTAEHLADLVELDADPEVMRHISAGAPNSRQRYVDELLPRMLAWDGHPFGFLAAYEGQQFQGWFHLRPSVADSAVLELGYRLRRAAWGRGLATEGARALVGYAFEQLLHPAVDACAHPDNAASIQVMIKCGMRRVGTFIHPRIPIEVVRYMIERAAWTAAVGGSEVSDNSRAARQNSGSPEEQGP